MPDPRPLPSSLAQLTERLAGRDEPLDLHPGRKIPSDGKFFPSGRVEVQSVRKSARAEHFRVLAGGDMRICVLVGNPRSGSRTRRIGELVASEITDLIGSDKVETIDLAD
ncbi:MAG TPA: hypothetical protein VGD43_11945, partial [Micromonospora sp.]